MYSSQSKAAKMVCQHLGWSYAMRPITAFKRGTTIYATGTLLKPDEWRQLAGHDGDQIGDCSLKITRIPR